jgi:hypothetical protein
MTEKLTDVLTIKDGEIVAKNEPKESMRLEPMDYEKYERKCRLLGVTPDPIEWAKSHGWTDEPDGAA